MMKPIIRFFFFFCIAINSEVFQNDISECNVNVVFLFVIVISVLPFATKNFFRMFESLTKKVFFKRIFFQSLDMFLCF